MIGANFSDVLGAGDTALFVKCVEIWSSRKQSNMTRSVYYDGEAALKDFGISLPPQMRSVAGFMGWSGRGVRAVTDRSRFEGLVSPDGSEDPFELGQVLVDNQFTSEYEQAKVSSAVHGTAFYTVSIDQGKPVLHPVSAEHGAGVWDRRKRRMAAFLEVVETNSLGNASVVVFYAPGRAVTIGIDERGKPEVLDLVEHNLGIVTAVPLPFNPDLRRPLGRSRISRASMYYADAALRTVVRAEVSAEFYSAPEYFLFGTDVSGFAGDDKWSAIMGRIKAWDYDAEAGESKPELHRFNGASPQPHTDQLRMWQALFAEDQDLQVTFADSANPSSADAIFAAKESLITVTEDANARWDSGALAALQIAVMLRERMIEPTPELRRLSLRSTDPRIVSPSARAAAYVQIASVDPVFATSRVGRSYAGLTQTQIVELEAVERRISDRSMMQLMLGDGTNSGGQAPESNSELDQANVTKAKADALGVLRRAGVDADNAAKLVGLDGVKFIPGQPITIKAPEDV